MMHPAQFGDAPNARETQIAIGILFGRSNKQTARDLGISPRTVEQYRDRLYVKFGAHNTVELVRILMSGAAG